MNVLILEDVKNVTNPDLVFLDNKDGTFEVLKNRYSGLNGIISKKQLLELLNRDTELVSGENILERGL